MADTAPIVHIGENSPEQVAFRLLLIIASNENKTIKFASDMGATADRKWLLSTYAECLKVVRSAKV